MSQALPLSTREQIISLRQSGQTLRSISASLGLDYVTVQRLCARYKLDPIYGLKPRYENCGKKRRGPDDFVYRAVRCFRSWHPAWGATKIRCEILRLRPDLSLPSVRTLQRWFHWNGQTQERIQKVSSSKRWANSVHEGWQIDGKEEVKLADGQKSSWLNIVDEHSSAIIEVEVFPLQTYRASSHNQNKG